MSVDRASGGHRAFPQRIFCARVERAELLRELANRGTMRGRREMTRVWEAIFPLVEPPPPGELYGVILLNSNARSHFALTNAIGVVGPSQLKALRLILQNTRHPWLILLHHQVVEYPLISVTLRERIGLALDQRAGSGGGSRTACTADHRAARPSSSGLDRRLRKYRLVLRPVDVARRRRRRSIPRQLSPSSAVG